jgi:hypothetical protein
MAYNDGQHTYSIGSANPVRCLLDIQAAQAEVAPVVGAVLGMDSAAGVFREALRRLNVDTRSIYPSGLPAVFRAARHRQRERGPSIAMDSAARASFEQFCPDAARIKVL